MTRQIECSGSNSSGGDEVKVAAEANARLECLGGMVCAESSLMMGLVFVSRCGFVLVGYLETSVWPHSLAFFQPCGFLLRWLTIALVGSRPWHWSNWIRGVSCGDSSPIFTCHGENPGTRPSRTRIELPPSRIDYIEASGASVLFRGPSEFSRMGQIRLTSLCISWSYLMDRSVLKRTDRLISLNGICSQTGSP